MKLVLFTITYFEELKIYQRRAISQSSILENPSTKGHNFI